MAPGLELLHMLLSVHMWGGVSQSFQAVSPSSERRMTSEPFVSHMLSRLWHAPVHNPGSRGSLPSVRDVMHVRKKSWLPLHFKSLLLVRVWESYQAASLCLMRERRWGNPPHPQSLPRAAALLREVCVCAKSLQSYSTLCNPIGLQSAKLLCPRDSPEEYWSGLPFSPPGDLPNPGIKPVSLTSTWTGRQILYH